MARRGNSEINAGSMADIAFLLLIFFLVTTTMDVDSGISRKLPEKQPDNIDPPPIKQKNIFEVNINRNNELLVEDNEMEVKDLREAAIEFLDNGGGLGKSAPDSKGTPCNYCEGKKDPKSSDHPSKAVISVQSGRGTSYGMYISVQNELLEAYSFLRNRYAKKYLKGKYAGMSYDELLLLEENSSGEKVEKDEKGEKILTPLQKAIKEIKEAYPQILSDAEPTK